MDDLITCTVAGWWITDGRETGLSLDGFGVGVFCRNCDASNAIIDCTFTGNVAREYEGGMVIYNSSPTVTGCDFSANSTNGLGGGMACVVDGNPRPYDGDGLGAGGTGDGSDSDIGADEYYVRENAAKPAWMLYR